MDFIVGGELGVEGAEGGDGGGLEGGEGGGGAPAGVVGFEVPDVVSAGE